MIGNGSQIGAFNLSSRKAASGVWGLAERASRIKQDIWPTVQDAQFANVKYLVRGNPVLNSQTPYDVTGNFGMRFTGPAGGGYVAAAGSYFQGAALNCTGGIYAQGNGSATGWGTNDFTLEGFVNFTALSAAQNFIDHRPPSTNGAYSTIYFDNSVSKLGYFVSSGVAIAGTSVVSVSTWYHYAYVRSGGNLGKLWLGVPGGTSVLQGSWADTTSYLSFSQVGLGGSPFGASMTGLIDECRLTVSSIGGGGARYTSAFTCPSERFPDY